MKPFSLPKTCYGFRIHLVQLFLLVLAPTHLCKMGSEGLVMVDNNHNNKKIPLDLALEKQLWLRSEPPIQALTWFRGNHVTAVATLQEKIAAIVQQNPWLGGTITDSSLLRSDPYLEFTVSDTATATTTTTTTTASHFMTHVANPDESPVTLRTPMDQVYDSAKPLLAMLDKKDHPSLWHVVIAPCRENPQDYFGVLISLSHYVGDAHVFYRLHDMLFSSGGGAERIQAMQVEAVSGFDAATRKALGDDVFDLAQASSPIMLLKFAVGVIKKLALRRQGREYWFVVDAEEMSHQKQQAVSEAAAVSNGVDFVSTNDVLVSWFYSRTGCSVALLCVDLRNKLLPGCAVERRHARNYWGNIWYQPPLDVDHPSKIRKSLSTFRRTESGSLPSALHFLATGSLGITTSWASSTGEANWNLSGCGPPEVHLPLFNFGTYCPSDFCVMRTFTLRKGQTGVYLAGDARMLEGVRNGAPFLRRLSSTTMNDLG